MSRLAEFEYPQIENPPCDGCAKFDRCKNERLACQAFVTYAGHAKGYARNPTRERYDRLFRTGGPR